LPVDTITIEGLRPSDTSQEIRFFDGLTPALAGVLPVADDHFSS
jgi:hypothetical protein